MATSRTFRNGPIEFTVPDDWYVEELLGLCADVEYPIVDGPFGSQMKVEDFREDGAVTVVEMEHLGENVIERGQLDRYLSDEKYKDVKRSHVESGDVIISKTGTIGRVAVVGDGLDEAIITSRLSKVTPDPSQLNPHFLRYWVERLGEVGLWDSIATGTTMLVLNLDDIRKTKISVPPVEEQLKIASVLGTVDELIQKSREVESILRRVRKGLVQDFLSQGLSDGEVCDSGTALGQLPAHWKVVNIEETIADENYSFTDGARYSLSSSEIHDQGEVRVILLEEVGEGEFNDSNPKFAARGKYKEIGHRAIHPGEVVVAKMAEPVARACIVPSTYDRYLLGCADVVRIVPMEDVEPRFLMYCMNSYKVWKQAVGHLRGTGRSRINLEDIAELVIPKPPVSEQRRIVNTLRCCDRNIGSEREYRGRLERLKQGLMEDLLSGTISTSDVEMDLHDEVAAYR